MLIFIIASAGSLGHGQVLFIVLHEAAVVADGRDGGGACMARLVGAGRRLVVDGCGIVGWGRTAGRTSGPASQGFLLRVAVVSQSGNFYAERFQ